MKRYHKKIYFPHKKEVAQLTQHLNLLSWSYTSHCLNNIQYRVADITDVLRFVKGLELKPETVFEYYKNDNGINKLCYL